MQSCPIRVEKRNAGLVQYRLPRKCPRWVAPPTQSTSRGINVRKTNVFAAALSAAPGILHAQFDFNVDGRDVQFHSFAQQGFALSNQNNYLTIDTSPGSFAMTDGGLNASTAITDKFRVGSQVYARNIGELGDYHVQLDWAYGDYKFKDWFGIRAGKVKTALGLLNDTQDAEFLYTWALLPQSLYPLDLRSNTIAHTGADVYGQIGLRKAGTLTYTSYWGNRTQDTRSGVYYGAADVGDPITGISGKTAGVDIHWNTPIQGLMLGGSWADLTDTFHAVVAAYGNLPFSTQTDPERITSGYGDYARGHWHFSGRVPQSQGSLDSRSARREVPFQFRRQRILSDRGLPGQQAAGSGNL